MIELGGLLLFYTGSLVFNVMMDKMELQQKYRSYSLIWTLNYVLPL